MSEWSYVAIAYIVVGGGLAVYALLLARRVSQARRVSDALRNALHDDGGEQDDVICDGQPAP